MESGEKVYECVACICLSIGGLLATSLFITIEFSLSTLVIGFAQPIDLCSPWAPKKVFFFKNFNLKITNILLYSLKSRKKQSLLFINSISNFVFLTGLIVSANNDPLV